MGSPRQVSLCRPRSRRTSSIPIGFTGARGLAAAATELETAVRLGASIVVVVFDADESDTPDLMRVAQSFGITAFAADSEPGFGEAFGRALGASGPSLIRV